MKKIAIILCAICILGGSYSCSDMLEAESSRQLFGPSLDQKTDSVFYAYGIMQAIQQLADQYYFQNELRGDLVKTTNKASTHLRNLANYSADATNKYDSVYRYYKVINNCNYYLAHRDTTLATGIRNVVCNEYAAVASFRAWTYLQLSRQYGAVPYIKEPVTTIAQIDASTEMTNWQTILMEEAAMLESLKSRYSDEQLEVPTFGVDQRSVGYLNWGLEKIINPRKCFIPLNVILGDIYLELGEYEKAATCYYHYLRYQGFKNVANISVNYTQQLNTNYSSYSPIFKDFTEWPVGYNSAMNNNLYGSSTWVKIFGHDKEPGDVITYIPMAVNYTNGQTSEIPSAFGYNYYSTTTGNEITYHTKYRNFVEKDIDNYSCPKIQDIQIVPSQTYCDSARKAQYYYFTTTQKTTVPFNYIVKNEALGDARALLVLQGSGADTSFVYTHKPSTANIPLYRNTTVWLHLAEAINRMGYPDAAFAVLKNGLHSELNNFRYIEVYQKDAEGNELVDGEGNKVINPILSHTDDIYYLTPESYELLTTRLPFLSQANSDIFRNGSTKAFVGIHFHGAGAVEYQYSSYIFKDVLKSKIDDVYTKFNLGTPNYSKDDYINAMEDLLCDEYAMEFAFEGTRYSDLRRIAIHKNQAAIYSGNFGDIWLSKMLQNNASGITTQNCYLPFK